MKRKNWDAGDSDEEPEETGITQLAARKLAARPALPPRRRGPADGSDASPSSDGASSGSEASGSDSESDSDAEAADIPLGELVALKQDGSTSAEAMKARAEALRNGKRDLKRKSKHHPSEMPSKKPVKVLRDTMQTGKREVRDPRFDDLTAGKYTDASFKKRYAFVYDEKLPQEKRELAAALKRAKNDGQKAEIKDRLARVTQDLKAEQSRRRRETVSKEMKAKEHAAVAAGKQPFYLKKSERRRQELVSKFEELKETGQLEKYMAKRRKKNAAKDHRYLPAGRRDGARGDE